MTFKLDHPLAALAVAFLAAASPVEACDMETKVRKIVILHTNDLHGHLVAWKGWEGELKGKTVGGLDRLAGAVAQVRKEHGEAVLLLDAGDVIGDTMIANLTEGRALIEALNYLGYDALAVGNHEPDFDMQKLRQRADEAKFPLLAANLVGDDGMLFTTPSVVKKVNGVNVGILGLAYPKTERTTAKKNVEKVTFQDPVPTVKRFLPKMRDDGAEVIVVLSHLGLSGDKKLAQAVEGIDVIVGGHSHNRMAEAERVGNTLIVQAGAHGSDLGRLDMTIKKGKITARRRTLVLLDYDTVPSDPSAKKLLERQFQPHRKALELVVGKDGDRAVDTVVTCARILSAAHCADAGREP